MGITWLFGFLSAFLSEPAIDFIFVVLTSLQGLFLFISFVCNNQVLSELRKKFKKKSSINNKCSKDRPSPTKDTSLNSAETSKTEVSKSAKHEKEKSASVKDKKKPLIPLDAKSKEYVKKVFISQIRNKFKRESVNVTDIPIAAQNVRLDYDAKRKKRESKA